MERAEQEAIAAEMRHLPREVRDERIAAARGTVIDGRRRFAAIVRRNFDEDDGS